MSIKGLTLTAAAALSLASLTACTDNTKIKEAVEHSLDKQKEMKSYTFEGGSTLAISDALMKSPNPLTNGLLSLVKESAIEWKGVSNIEPLQFQTDLKLTPKGSASSFEIPVLIKDSKMYFNMPALNKTADEYYVIDLQQLSQNSKSPLTLDTLKNSSQLTTSLSGLIFRAVDAKWYKEEKEPVKLKDGTTAKAVSIELTAKNEKEVNTMLQAKMPEFISMLQSNGLLAPEQAEQLKKSKMDTVRVHAPSKLNVVIDNQGFIRDESMDLSFTAPAADGKAVDNRISLHQVYNDINQAAPLTKETPKNAKSFDDILKLLTPPKK